MDFEHSPRARAYMDRLTDFMEAYVYPDEHVFHDQIAAAANKWAMPPLMVELKDKAKAAGLWNLFLSDPAYGPGLSNLEYAPLAEIFGRVIWAPEIFNCNPPDAGNMELLLHYADDAQKARWLKPLLDRPNPLGLCDDRAGGGLVRRDQYRDPDPARRRRLRH